MTIVTVPTAPVASRADIMEVEDYLKGEPGQFELELKHHFTEGMYAREAYLPAGTRAVGKIHKHAHFTIILSGSVRVWSEFGTVDIIAPCTFHTPAGTKRVVYAYEDTVWTTVHLNSSNTEELTQLEEELIAPSYASLLEENT